MIATPQQFLDADMRDLILRKVRKMIGRAGLQRQDCQDLEQELTVGLLRRLPAYDSRRSPRHAFLRVVVNQLASNVLRNRMARRRDARKTRSLWHSLPHTREGIESLEQAIASQTYHADGQHRPNCDAERTDLKMDLADVLAKAPASLRELAEHMLQGHSIAAIARSTGIPRTTLQGRLKRLRRLCERAGLRTYLDS